MKKLLLVIFALGVLSAGALKAREIRTPLPLQTGIMQMHYPVHYHWERERCAGDCWAWESEFSGMGYYRSADKAFGTCDGQAKVPYTNLIFGKSDFTIGEAFPGGAVSIANNPFVNISTLSPRFEYREAGAMFFAGVTGYFDWCDNNYRLGVRGRLPVRDIEVVNTCPAGDNLSGLTLSDVWRTQIEQNTINGTPQNVPVFAGRLDFLAQLDQIAFPPELLVNFHDATQANHVTMAGVKVDEAIDLASGAPYVAGTFSANGAFPTVPWGHLATDIDGVIGTDGSTTGSLNQFIAANDYTPLSTNIAAQSHLFITPTLQGVGGANPGTLSQGATTIRNALLAAIQGIDTSVADFLKTNGISFCNGRTKGVGDLDAEIFFGRNWCNDDIWTDLILGFRFATGKEWCNCRELLKQPAGNNKHNEVRIGLQGGYDMSSCFKFYLDGSYSWALKHRERIAAPFTGATIKNIGPCIDADIKWSYFLGHFDLSVFANECCGFDIGYELYYKRPDCVKLCNTTATTFTGVFNQPLDASIATRNTKRIAHKARVAFFSTLGDCTIEGGWQQVFAGQNITRDTDWFLKLGVRF